MAFLTCFFKSFTQNVLRDSSTNRWQHSIRILSKFSQVQTSVICLRLFHLISVVSKNYFYIGIHSWVFKTQDFVKVFPRTNIPVCNLSPSIPYIHCFQETLLHWHSFVDIEDAGFCQSFPKNKRQCPACNLPPSISYPLSTKSTLTLAFIHEYLRRRILSKFSQEQTSMVCL